MSKIVSHALTTVRDSRSLMTECYLLTSSTKILRESLFRKTYCWYDHQARLYECPCSDINGEGCGSSEFCQSYPEYILITREGAPSWLYYGNVLVPPETIDTFSYIPFENTVENL